MKTITRAEFDKKVEMEFAHLSYVERMPEDKARAKAMESVSQEYRVG